MTESASQTPLSSWETYAASWDLGMGDEGNDYFQHLELPILEKLIINPEGSLALDLATGNGLVARWLARKGATVVATDGAPSMVERAIARTAKLRSERNISFYVLDVTSSSSCDHFVSRIARTLPVGDSFDIVSMNMAVMDIPDLEILASFLGRILTPNGCFVATLLHPMFFTSGASRQILVKEDPTTGQEVIVRSINLQKYLNAPPVKQLVLPGDANIERPFLFHRPLHQLFAPFFQAGLVMDALEETNFGESFYDPLRQHSSRNFTEFPKILGFRMRRAH
ncbi:hypothetical protein N7462_008134 [Penicillium macrosclerotiorum]|uniref:uncharacterized protein n=1 Tax=Penicillium macrosclerotiorum TaxID=303699 RepID=UPI002548D2C7|nr:uncharacterized protein N7462_008134 [Penicillium macrosclerotiorum]KAJ5679890.1 hypothetical protein N7462_008134 [Penicillium macrosclerotiorum]